ncbi:MAG: hypothetical protein HQL47_12255, partial [Gammaproteobacteria bacterium]|nr:hypothetical protein [Gammaproteobacteria bacterium]
LRSVWTWQFINQKALDELENSLRRRLDEQDDSEARDELEQLRICREELENFAILSLWAVFEETLNSWLAQRTYWAVASEEGDRNIRESLLRRIQHWSMAEKIDALQPVFGNEVTHNLQNLRKWRDWVAHRKTGPRPEAVDADMAESLFSEVIAQLEVYPEDRMVALA